MSILGTALPAANTLATLYEVPTGRRAVEIACQSL